jgi:transposase
MLYAGLDLSRKRLDFCLLDQVGKTVEIGAAPPDADGLRGLAARLARFAEPVQAAIESMNGARFVHDQLEQAGWEVEIADAVKVKGLAPLACKTDRIDARVLAELARRDLVPAIWLPDPRVRAERERARFRLHLVRHRTSLKQRVHAVLLAHGKPCPVSDLFGVAGRTLLERLALPQPWAGTVDASLQLIDELDQQITACEIDLRRLGADHRYVPLLTTAPGIAWVLGYTIAAEIGDINRFASPRKLVGYTGLCPRVYQSGERDLRAALKAGPPLPPLGARRGRNARLHASRLSRPLPADQGADRQAARRQGRPDRPRPPTRRSDLAHAQPRATLRSQRRHRPPGRLTALKEMRHRSEPQSALSSRSRRR